MRYVFAEKDIDNVVQGDAFERAYQYTTTYDFTGKTFLCQVRKSDGDEEVILEFKVSASTMVVDIPTKTITLKQTAAVMQNVIPGQYTYDIKGYTNLGVDDQRVQKGKFIIGPTTTR